MWQNQEDHTSGCATWEGLVKNQVGTIHGTHPSGRMVTSTVRPILVQLILLVCFIYFILME